MNLRIKNSIFVAMIGIFVSFFLTGCVKTGLKSINGLAKFGDYNVYKDIVYGDDSLNKLNLYIPKNKKIKATIVFFYGGCWGHCSQLKKDDYLFVAQTLTKHGYAVVIPDYQKFPKVKFDTIINDAKEATNWAINSIEKYGAPDNNIYLMGHSAGAHIAAMLTDNEEYLGDKLPHVIGFIGLAGPYNFYPFNAQYMYELFDSKNEYYDSQPIHFINGNEPPHLLIQSKTDDRVFIHNTVDLAKKLDLHDIKNTVVLIEKMSHARILVEFSKPLRKNSIVVNSIIKFIDKN